MFCTQCGKECVEGVKFCAECGGKVSDLKRGFPIGCGIVGVIFLLILFGMWTKGQIAF